jgi:cysteine desulfurase
MGLSQELAQGAIRVSLGFGTVCADIERFIGAWRELIKRMRQRQEAA